MTDNTLRALVKPTRCDCHPETCCCGPDTLYLDGKHVVTGYAQRLQPIVDAINGDAIQAAPASEAVAWIAAFPDGSLYGNPTLAPVTPYFVEWNANNGHPLRPLIFGEPTPPGNAALVADRGPAWTDEDMQKPWGAEVASLRHLADDPALNTAQAAMLRHCAKRIERTAALTTVDETIIHRLRVAGRALIRERGVLYAEDVETIADVIKLLESLATQAQPQAQEAGRGRWFADGPQGWFMADDLELARALVNAYDKDDDWTITYTGRENSDVDTKR